MNNTKQSSTNNNLKILAYALGSEYTTKFNNRIANTTSINEAIFINWFLYMWNEKSKNGKMFLMENSFLERSSISRHSFRKIVKKWEDLHLIKTYKKGIPPKKYYSINESKLTVYLESILDNSCKKQTAVSGSKIKQQETDCLKGKKPTVPYINTKILNTKRDPKESLSPGTCKNAGPQRNVIPGNGKPLLPNKNIPSKPTFADRMSKKLYKKVKSKNQLPFNSKSRSRWTATFTSMLKEDGRNKKRIRTVLEWYIEHYGEDFIPEARCANTFRKKFCEIEAAMKRSSVADGNGKSTRSVIVNYAEERIMD